MVVILMELWNFFKTQETSKIQNLGFLRFVGEILYKSYLISCFNRD